MPVREARRDEAGDIAELWTELVAYHRQLDPNLPQVGDDGMERYAYHMLDRIERPDSLVLVAVDTRGVVVGYALAFMIDLVPDMFRRQRAGLLADIYVQAASRGQGYGRAMVERVIGWCQLNQLGALEWEVAAANESGRAFWRAMGGSDLMVRMRRNLSDE